MLGKYWKVYVWRKGYEQCAYSFTGSHHDPNHHVQECVMCCRYISYSGVVYTHGSRRQDKLSKVCGNSRAKPVASRCKVFLSERPVILQDGSCAVHNPPFIM